MGMRFCCRCWDTIFFADFYECKSCNSSYYSFYNPISMIPRFPTSNPASDSQIIFIHTIIIYKAPLYSLIFPISSPPFPGSISWCGRLIRIFLFVVVLTSLYILKLDPDASRVEMDKKQDRFYRIISIQQRVVRVASGLLLLQVRSLRSQLIGILSILHLPGTGQHRTRQGMEKVSQLSLLSLLHQSGSLHDPYGIVAEPSSACQLASLFKYHANHL